MKNVLIYVNPAKKFVGDAGVLAKVQVDNAYRVGWKPRDILIFTNFPWEYNGVRASSIDDTYFCEFRPRSINTLSIPYLFSRGVIERGEIYWVHDFDAYQEAAFDLNLTAEVGLTTYGWSPKWCMGSFFFTHTANDFFQAIKDKVYEIVNEDERALRELTKSNHPAVHNRYQVLNITYNFGMRNVGYNYSIADKPIKVLHFHPDCIKGEINTKEIFFHGKNELGFPLITNGLREVFRTHGIQ